MKKPARKTLRLKHFDYSQNGFYFVTICVQDYRCLFGKVIDGKMELNRFGEVVRECWLDLENRFSDIFLDEFVIMPNHFHGIIFINVGATLVVARENDCVERRATTRVAPTLGDIIGAFKSITTLKYYKLLNRPVKKLWQRNYYEHIIRSEKQLAEIREYVNNNPIGWKKDKFFIN